MPYLQVDLDALDEFPAVARASGITEGDAIRGCLHLWRWCWKTKTTTVTVERLAGFFGCDGQRIATALSTCGFLSGSAPMFTVRGAEKRLGIAQARAKGGQKASRNLRQFTGSSPAQAGREPDGSSGSAPGLTSSIQHPASRSPDREEEGTPSRSASQRESDEVETDRPSSHAPEALRGLWNSLKAPEQPEWREDAKSRHKAAQSRLRERALDGAEGWEGIIRRIAASPFCRGQNERGWVADPDFLLRPGTAAKVLEGKYDARGNGKLGAPVRAESVNWANQQNGVFDEL